MRASNDLGDFRPIENDLKATLSRLAGILSAIKTLDNIVAVAEEQETQDPELEKRAHKQQDSILAAGLLANVAASLLLTIFFSLGVSKRLIVMSDNARRLANEETLNFPVGGADEIADLDSSFHKAAEMLVDTRRRERAVFDNSKDVLCILTKDGKFSNLNPAAELSWGYDKDALMNQGLRAILDPNDLASMTPLLSGNQNVGIEESLETQVIRKDGGRRWTRWTISRPKGQQSTFCVARDVTEAKLLEQLRKDFLAVVSHDLRTPLTGVLGIANLISANAFGPVSEPGKSQLKTIERHCDALLELTNDILDLEKMEAGQMQLALHPVELADIFTALSKIAQTNEIPLQLKITGEANKKALACDSERLTQALANFTKYLSYRETQNTTPSLTRVNSRAANLNTAEFVRVDAKELVAGASINESADASTASPASGPSKANLDPNAGSAARHPVRCLANYMQPGIEFRIFDFDNAKPIPEAVSSAMFDRHKDESLKEDFADSMFRAELAIPLAAKIITAHGGTIQIETSNNSNCFVVRIPYEQKPTT